MKSSTRTDTYTVNVHCSNCDHRGTQEIPRGTPVPSSIECPNCGCNTARKSGNPDPYYPKPARKPFYPPTFPDRHWEVQLEDIPQNMSRRIKCHSPASLPPASYDLDNAINALFACL